jgi:hypothetical protein
MSHRKLAATAVLTCALVAPAVPAVAVSSAPAAPQVSQSAQTAAADTFLIHGVITQVRNADPAHGIPARVYLAHGTRLDAVARVTAATHIYKFGRRVDNLHALKVGDHADIRGFFSGGHRYATVIADHG